MNKFFVAAMTGLTLLALSNSGLAQSSGSVTIQWGDHPSSPPPPPPPPPVEVYQHPAGPPPHAPAHGYRAKHQYRYYPYRNVYYEPVRRLYFYMGGDGWAFGASLPSHLTVAGLGTYVSIGLDNDQPYHHNDAHVRMYPRDKYKGHKGKDDDDDDSSGGHGHGKGKGGKK